MLYYKHGTLSEDRFKNLTTPQWLFHYLEILRLKNKEYEYSNNLLEVILDRIEVLWILINPKIGKDLIAIKNKDKRQNLNIDGISPANFKDQWTEMLKHAPKKLTLPPALSKKNQLMPTFSRKRLRDKVLGLDTKG